MNAGSNAARLKARLPWRPNRPLTTWSLAKLFRGDEGAIAVMFGLCASVMIGGMCTALDMINFTMTEERIQMAADVAALSAAANRSHFGTPISGADLAQWQKDARAYYDANIPTGYLGLSLNTNGFSATVSGDPTKGGETIQVSVSGSMPLLAPKIFGSSSSGGSGSGTTVPNNSTQVSATNAVLRLPKSTLELVMVLDNTGSMASRASSTSSGTKIDGLKAAAHTLVQLIMTQSGADSYIGMVPFTSTVNVGNALPSGGAWMNPVFTYNPKGVGMTSSSTVLDGWNGCPVEPRDSSGNMYPAAYYPSNLTTPTADERTNSGAPLLKFTPYFYNVPANGLRIHSWNPTIPRGCASPSDSTATNVPVYLKGGGGTTSCSYTPQSNGIYADWAQVATGTNPSATNDPSTVDILRQNDGCMTTRVTFLTTDRSKLDTAIDAMVADGSTLIPVGVLWGWRMLSSSWSDARAPGSGWISSNSNLPIPEKTTDGYDTPGLQRVMIVLTDGDNEIGSSTDLENNLYFNGLSGVGTKTLPARTVTQLNGATMPSGSMDSVPNINAFQVAACRAARASGVAIYAITFGNVPANSVAAMTSCANPGNYYNAPNNAALTTIFQQIAGNLGVLRLTQ